MTVGDREREITTDNYSYLLPIESLLNGFPPSTIIFKPSIKYFNNSILHKSMDALCVLMIRIGRTISARLSC